MPEHLICFLPDIKTVQYVSAPFLIETEHSQLQTHKLGFLIYSYEKTTKDMQNPIDNDTDITITGIKLDLG